MRARRNSLLFIMKRYYQLILLLVCVISVVSLLVYRHEYIKLRSVLEVFNFFGKPGLSKIEFCGPGFNATMLSEIMRNTTLEVRETPPLFQQIDENFYTYSSFLRSYQKYEQLTPSHPHEIDTIVVGKANIHPNFRCNIWLENSMKPKAGRFSFDIVSEPINDFRVYVFHCVMSKDFGKPKAISFYTNDYNINPIHAPINQLISVNTKRKPRVQTSIKFVNKIIPTVCVIPNQVPVVPRDAFIDFLVFHHMMGVDNFVIYDSTISEDIIRRLNLLPTDITQWDIKFFPLNYPFVFAKSYDIIRNAIELDCMFRHFRIDKDESNNPSHAIVLPWDEFIVPRFHNNLQSIIQDFDPMRKYRTIEIKPLLFCLNQNDDDNVEEGYPNIVKKTQYYVLPQKMVTAKIRNLDTMSSFNDIIKLDVDCKVIEVDNMAIHKYTECKEKNSFSPFGYNETQLQMFPHKFEGAMIKYSQILVDNKIYRLYRSGQIWEKTSGEDIRDML